MARLFRWTSAILSVALMLVIGAALTREVWRPAPSVRLVSNAEELEALLAERAAEAEVLEPSAVGLAVGGVSSAWDPLKRTPISEKVTTQFFSMIAKNAYIGPPRKIYDPLAYFVSAPGWQNEIYWPEHPFRRWKVKYSMAGFRNPYEPADPPPQHRVILCGDSHIEGVVPYQQTVSAVLERKLREHLGTSSVEVLNGASGGYNFYNYLGFLERCLPLHPQVYVLVLYGGNDFVEVLGLHAYFERIGLDLHSERLRDRTNEGAAASSGAMSQAFHQLSHFQERPVHVEVTYDAAVRAMRDIDALAKRAGIALVTAYLPPQVDVRPQDMREELATMVRIFEMDEDDLELIDRLADRLIGELARQGIPIIDLRPALRASPERVYWVIDHHLNTRGSEIVARELLPHVIERLTTPQ